MDVKAMDTKALEDQKRVIEQELHERKVEQQKAEREVKRLFWKRISELPREVIDVIAPDHGRTSCDDENLDNGVGSIRNGRNAPRCTRCLLLELLTGYAATPEELAELDAVMAVEIQTRTVS